MALSNLCQTFERCILIVQKLLHLRPALCSVIESWHLSAGGSSQLGHLTSSAPTLAACKQAAIQNGASQQILEETLQHVREGTSKDVVVRVCSAAGLSLDWIRKGTCEAS